MNKIKHFDMQSKKESDYLYTLIKSLSRTEKAYFKKYAKRHVIGNQNKYVELFDAVDGNAENYNEKIIIEKFQNERFVKNFPVMKNYLYKMILKSLGSYYSDSNNENEVKNEVTYIEILYKKGLFFNSKKILMKSLKTAYRTDNFPLLLELLRWKKNLIIGGVFEENQYINLEEACKEEQDIIKKIKNLSDYRTLAYLARSLIVGNNPHIKESNTRTELLNILKHPLLQSEKRALSYPSIMTYYHTLATVNDSLNRSTESLAYRKGLISLMENHPEKIKDNITNYVVALYNILGTCLNMKKYAELENYINKLRLLEKTHQTRISKNNRMNIVLGSLFYELRTFFDRGEFSRLSQKLPELEKELKNFSAMIIKSDELYFYYLLAYGYFGAGKFEESLMWNNKILNDKSSHKENKLYNTSKILNLILHYELGNWDLLEYLTESLYRDFKKSDDTRESEKVLIDLLKQLPDISNIPEQENLFKQTLNFLRMESQPVSSINKKDEPKGPDKIQNNFENIAEIDLEDWLESKINGKKFADKVREKYLTSLKIQDKFT